MHSSSPDCVFGDARLISSTRTTLANTGPGWNSKPALRWLKTLVPTRSAGRRSEVHWTRAYSASSERASERASAVLPTPGASSISTCPSASSATIRSRTTRSDAFTARAMFSASRVPISATPEGSSLGAVAIASWYAGLQAAYWLSPERSEERWSEGHVPGAIHLPDADVEAGTKRPEEGARLIVIGEDAEQAKEAA